MDLPQLDALELNRAALLLVRHSGEAIPTPSGKAFAWHDEPLRLAVTFWFDDKRSNVRIFRDALRVFSCFWTADADDVDLEFYAAGSWRDEFLERALVPRRVQ